MTWGVTIEAALQAWVVAGSGLASDHVIWAEQNASRPSTPFITLQLTTLQQLGHDWLSVVDNPLTIADDDVELVDFANNELDLTAHGLLTGDGPIQLISDDRGGTLPTGLSLLTDYWVIKKTADAIQLASTFPQSIAAVPTPVTFSDVGVGTHTIVDTSETARAGIEINNTARGSRMANLSIQCFASDPIGASGAAAILNNVLSAVILPTNKAALVTAGVGVAGFDAVSPISGVLGSTTWEPRAVVNGRFFIAQESTEAGTYIETATDPVGTYT